MKKVLVFFLAVSLFTACNNDKGKDKYDRDRKSDNRESDDYRKSDDRDNEDDRNTDREDDRKTDDNDTRGSWSSMEVNAFVTNCVSSAAQGGAMTEEKASDYCNCMVKHFQRMYPNPKDAGNVSADDLQSAEMQDLMKGCLGLK